MPSRETQEYIKNQLPYEILKRVYKNSRLSLRALGRELNISYHVVKTVLNKLEDKYNLAYTLDLDEVKLGFAKAKIVIIKFSERPGIDAIKKELVNDPYVQNAYLVEGDFDLMLHIVGLSTEEFGVWQWLFRLKFNNFKVKLEVADISRNYVGFLPLRSELLLKSPVLSHSEKQILVQLNNNSKEKLSEIARKLKVKDLDRLLYIIRKLKNNGIIKSFSALTQNPDKTLFYVFSVYVNPSEQHSALVKKFNEEIFKEENNIVSTYSFMSSMQGFCDGIYLCVFKDGEELAKKGPDLIKSLWSAEDPIIKKGVITGILVGKWPFHLEEMKIK
ncbi:MAG: hypothetical protein ACP5FN_03245 [Candidatus Micrarchaeia archaeon]